MDTTPSDPAPAPIVVEHEGPAVTRWEWTDPDGTARRAHLAHLPGGAGLFREGPGQLQFPVGSLDDARALVSDLALAERIETPDGTTVYRPERVLLTVGEGVTYPFKAPGGWHDRIRALDGFVRFGPRYRPLVLEALLAMDAAMRDGWSVGAYDHLVAAERAARA
jgi:hypothetical protein